MQYNKFIKKYLLYFLLFFSIFGNVVKVKADVLYSQPNSLGSISSHANAGEYKGVKVGSFVSPISGSIDDGLIEYNIQSNDCTSYARDFYISTSSTATNSSDIAYAVYSQGGLPATVGSHHVNLSPSSGSPFVSGTTYYIYFSNYCGVSSNDITFVADSLDTNFFGLIMNSGGSLFTDTTHFITISPSNLEYVSTSTGIELISSLYIKDSDFHEDEFIRYKYVRNQDLQSSVANTDLLWKTIDDTSQPSNSGTNVSSTTTLPLLKEGQYTLIVELRKPSTIANIASWWGLDGLFSNGAVVISTTTQFIAGQRLAYDTFLASSTEEGANFFSSTTISTADVKKYCSFSTDFAITDCIKSLFIPSYTKIDATLHLAQEGFFSHAPFGYITRTISIFNNSATSSLPTFTVPIRTGQNTTTDTIYLTYDMNDMVKGAGNVLEDTRDPYNGKNIKDIFYEIIQLVVAIAVLIVIIKDVMGSHKHESDLPKGKNV